MDIVLDDLTPAERLLIERLRLGETQAEAARSYGVSKTRYWLWERGVVDYPYEVQVEPLAPHETCVILRRRAGYYQAELADQVANSRRGRTSVQWIKEMEKGRVPCTPLVEYWRRRVGDRRRATKLRARLQPA